MPRRVSKSVAYARRISKSGRRAKPAAVAHRLLSGLEAVRAHPLTLSSVARMEESAGACRRGGWERPRLWSREHLVPELEATILVMVRRAEPLT